MTAFSVAAVGALLLLVAYSRNVPFTARATAPDDPAVAVVDCSAGTTDVITSTVETQDDGVHVEVRGEGAVSGLEFRADGRSVAIVFPAGARHPVTDVVTLPVGSTHVTCGGDDGPGGLLSVVDPRGVWHPSDPSCSDGPVEREGIYVFYNDVNPEAAGIARSVPGIAPTDVVAYAGAPASEVEAGDFIVVRDSEVVASLQTTSYGDRTFVGWVTACDATRIGEPGAPTAGLLATPFALPELPTCDPYGASCEPVYVSAAFYARTTSTEVSRYTRPTEPWMACTPSQPSGCPQDPTDAVLPVVTTPDAAAAFVDRQGCGDAAERACA